MRARAIRMAFLPSCIGALAAIWAVVGYPGRESRSRVEAPPAAAVAPVTAAPTASIPTGIEPPSSDLAAARPARPSTSIAARKPASVPPRMAPSTHSAPGLAGMVIAVDPETGELGMPSPEQMRDIGARMAETQRVTPDGFTEIHRPDGAVGLELGGRLQSYEMVWIGPDGKLALRCVASSPEAAAKAGTPAPALEDR